MGLVIDITGVPQERMVFSASPLAELTAMLHALSVPQHHPDVQDWTTRVRTGLRPDLAERLAEAEFLWHSSRADFLLPHRPHATLQEELDDLDALDDERYVTTALVTTCGSDRVLFAPRSPLTDAHARERAMALAGARGPAQADFAERLLADPPLVRSRVRRTLEECGPAFFDETWQRIGPRLAADARLKTDLLARRGLADTLASVSAATGVDHGRDGSQVRITVDKLQDNSADATGHGVTFIPTAFGNPHLVCVHARNWRPVLQYPLPPRDPDPLVPFDVISQRLDALANPLRLRLVRTLARGPRTTGELATAWGLTAPEVSRHLAVLRKAGLLTTRRRGRYVHYELDATTTSALGTDLLDAVLR